MLGKAWCTAASRRCRKRPSRCSAHSSWPHFRSEPRSSACAVSRTASIRMSSSTRRLMPWRTVTARLRPNALPVSTRGWRPYPIPGRERGPGSGRAAAFLRYRKRLHSTPPISIQGGVDELRRNQSVRRLCRPDLVDDGGRVVCPDRAPPGGGPFWLTAPRLAPGAVRVRFLHDHPLVHRPDRRALRYADVER